MMYLSFHVNSKTKLMTSTVEVFGVNVGRQSCFDEIAIKDFLSNKLMQSVCSFQLWVLAMAVVVAVMGCGCC